MDDAEVAALYRGVRIGGDFFDFALAGLHCLLVLMDIAGERGTALEIAARVQRTFRIRARELFGAAAVNEAEALTELAHNLNQSLIEAAGAVCCAPAFLASYNQALGTVWYLNAGHIPALARDPGGVRELGPGGLPLGLFTHVTHNAEIFVLVPGSVLVMVSRGLVEARAGRAEFGLGRVRQVVAECAADSAQGLCSEILARVGEFQASAPGWLPGPLRRRACAAALRENDTTVLALMRMPAQAPGFQLQSASHAAAL